MQPREITGFAVEGEPVVVRVLALDMPQDGASHEYRVERSDGAQVGSVTFHRGQIEENVCDVNGVTHESLIAILLDRLRGFQTGEYAHKQNEFCIKRLEEALKALHVRTKERLGRGVENLQEV